MESHDPVVHGALDHAELARLGLRAADLLDFSSNINPFGPPDAVRAALAALDPAPYPDRSCLQLRKALALRHGAALDNVLAGNGSNELIHLLARALLHTGDTALVIVPAFGEYAHACRLAGAQVLEWRLGLEQSLDDEITAMPELLNRLKPRLTWLCAPNNPTGSDPSPQTIRRLADDCAAYGGLLVVDRAYAGMRRAAGSSDELDADPPLNLLRLHSLTKIYAMAGLRLGYLLGSADLLAPVARYQPAWSVSSAAQAAGLAALTDADFVAATLPRLWAASDALVDGLQQRGLMVHRAALPFMLLRSGNGAQTRARLMQCGCVVRDCASFGLGEWVRIAPRREEERALVRGLVVNRFRGDPALFAEGIAILEQRSGLPVLGLVPWLNNPGIAEEDAVALERPVPVAADGGVSIAVVHLPTIANFDDFDPLAAEPGVHLRYIERPEQLNGAAAVILPGVKHTLAARCWLRERGFDAALAGFGGAVVGICGGYQLLGERIRDPQGVEGGGGNDTGLGLLPIETVFSATKRTEQIMAVSYAPWAPEAPLHGYEIHMGRSDVREPRPLAGIIQPGSSPLLDGCLSADGRIWGCYIHGLFANDAFRRGWLGTLGWQGASAAGRLDPYERLADHVEAVLDKEQLGRLLAVQHPSRE